MASDADQELWRLRPKGVPIWLLVIFILLALGSVVGAAFLFKEMALARKKADDLNALVERHLEMPLRELGVHVEPNPDYNEFFFSMVKRYVVLGSELAGYQRVVGWNTRKELLHAAKGATDIRRMLANLSIKVAAAQDEIELLQDALRKVQAEQQYVSMQSEELRKNLQKRLTQLLQEIRQVTRQIQKEEAQLQTKVTALARARKEKQNEINSLKSAIAKEKNLRVSAARKYKATIASLNKRIEQLKIVPPLKPGPPGGLVDVNMALKFAVVNIGRNKGVKKGDVFNVYEHGKGGKKVYKGRIAIRAVGDDLSQATIVDLKDPRNPIIAGDWLERPAKPAPKAKRQPR